MYMHESLPTVTIKVHVMTENDDGGAIIMVEQIEGEDLVASLTPYVSVMMIPQLDENEQMMAMLVVYFETKIRPDVALQSAVEFIGKQAL